MASERQIAANRRNAQKSTGPTSGPGKRRSGKNAYRHGLSLPVCNVGSHKHLKDLSRQFAGDASDAKILGLAEIAAVAHTDLVRVRNVTTAMLERALMQTQGTNLDQPELLGSSRPLRRGNEEEEQRFVNAVRHILPELTKIWRYEKRAASRRDRAIQKIASMKTLNEK
jgi:hypothetical protein